MLIMGRTKCAYGYRVISQGKRKGVHATAILNSKMASVK